MQGMALVHHIFGNDPDSKPTTENVASAVFTTPQIATIGYTEESAREKFPNLNIFTSTFRCDALFAPCQEVMKSLMCLAAAVLRWWQYG